jgi:TonB family protein
MEMIGYRRIELKRRYQINMLLSFLIAAFLVMPIFGLVAAFDSNGIQDKHEFYSKQKNRPEVLFFIPIDFFRIKFPGPCTVGPFIKTKDPGEFCDNGAVMPIRYGTIDLSSIHTEHPNFIDKSPELTRPINSIYPKRAKWEGRESDVWIRALIDKTGKIVEARAINPSPENAGFDEAATEAACNSIWKPAIANGQPVAVWVSFAVKFKLH